MDFSEVEKLSLVELRVFARKAGVKSVTSYKKGELLEVLRDQMGKKSQETDREVKSSETNMEHNRPERKKAKNGNYAIDIENKKNRSRTEKETDNNSAEIQHENTEKRIQGRGNRYSEKNRKDSKLGNNGRKMAEKNNASSDGKNPSERMQGSQRQEMRNTSEHVQEAAQQEVKNSQSGRDFARADAATAGMTELKQLDSGETKSGILEVMTEGYGFIRCDNYLPGEADVYVSPAMIRRFSLRTGDILVGNTRTKNQNEKFSALLYVKTVNGYPLEKAMRRARFEKLTPIFPNDRIHLEVKGESRNISMRMMDLISPIGKGQRGMIVSQPKTGKTTLLKQVAKSVKKNHPSMKLIVLLIDERPEEVTDIKESIEGNNVEVIYSTFDELPENHKRVSEMVIERAKRLVEHGEDVIILLDSITRLARAYNLTVQPSGRTLSGGLDPAALHMPKRFFGAARNMREGGSLTILATALVDTGSKMDDVVFEEFKGTGNMEMVLDRSLSEKRLFPAIDLPKSSTRRDDLLLSQEEMEANILIRKAFQGGKMDDAVQRIIQLFRTTKDNEELMEMIKKGVLK